MRALPFCLAFAVLCISSAQYVQWAPYRAPQNPNVQQRTATLRQNSVPRLDVFQRTEITTTIVPAKSSLTQFTLEDIHEWSNNFLKENSNKQERDFNSHEENFSHGGEKQEWSNNFLKENSNKQARDFNSHETTWLTNCGNSINIIGRGTAGARFIFYMFVFPTVYPLQQLFQAFEYDVVQILFQCFVLDSRRLYGDNPSTAVADISGQLNGTIYVIQQLPQNDAPEAMSIMGNIKGLDFGRQYTMSLYEGGLPGANCSALGARVDVLGNSTFTGKRSGDAWILVEEERFNLETLLGRSIVVEAVDGGQRSCGVIVRDKRTNLPQL